MADASQVTSILEEIAKSSREQSSDIWQINGAIMLLDEVTQQNAALVEQASTAANALQEQAIRLAETVAFFMGPSSLGGLGIARGTLLGLSNQ